MEQMILTPRLRAVAELVPQGARLADIGTDHGKLPITLMLEGRLASAIGSEIRSGPLQHAKQNAADYGLADQIQWRLAAGLNGVCAQACDTVTIAGMGGETIAGILNDAPWTELGEHLLLLQPMTMAPLLRQYLWSRGYEILQETVCREGRRYYLVLAARGGAQKKNVPLPECVFSDALLRADGAREYLQRQCMLERKALTGMEKSKEIDEIKLSEQKMRVQLLQQALEEIRA